MEVFLSTPNFPFLSIILVGLRLPVSDFLLDFPVEIKILGLNTAAAYKISSSRDRSSSDGLSSN